LILSDTNRFYLKGTPALHLATVLDGLKEYICFYLNGNIYIEEITGGHLEYIKDEEKVDEIRHFLEEAKVLDATRPLLPDDVWLRPHEK